MNELEQKIYEGMLEKVDTDGLDLSDVDADTLIFASDAAKGKCIGLDSIDVLELVVLIYEEWGIDVPGEDLSKLRTIRNIADYVVEHMG